MQNDSNFSAAVENDPFESKDYRTFYGTHAITNAKAPLIVEGIRSLRAYIGGIQAKPSKDQYGPKFPVKSAKELFNKLAQALHDLNMLAYVVDQQFTHFPYEYTAKDGNKKTGTCIHVKSTVRIAASDGSHIDVVGSGHGRDNEDKAGGKASTYATKDALLKGLCIGEEDIDDTDNGNVPDTAETADSPAGEFVPQPANAEAPKRRGRPPGTGKKVTGEAMAPSVTPPAADKDVDKDFIVATCTAFATAKSLAEVYQIRDEKLKPRSKAIQEACTASYAAARDHWKSKEGK